PPGADALQRGVLPARIGPPPSDHPRGAPRPMNEPHPSRRALLKTAGGLLAAPALAGLRIEAADAPRAELLAHWPLHGDTRDVSGGGHHAENRGTDLDAAGPTGAARTAARFAG